MNINTNMVVSMTEANQKLLQSSKTRRWEGHKLVIVKK